MKLRFVLQVMALAALFAPLSPRPVLSSGGGVDGGGGNIPQSSAYDVKEAIKKTIEYSIPHTFYNLGFAFSSVKDPYVKRILYSMYDNPTNGAGWEDRQPILNDLKNTTYEIQETEACLDPRGNKHAASVQRFGQGAPICLSVKLLRTIPKDDLENQILALLAHEYAHHFGFGEFEATKFQIFILHRAQSLKWFEERSMIYLVSPIEIEPTVEKNNFETELIFQNGKIIKKEPKFQDITDPYCSLSARLDDKTVDDISKNKSVRWTLAQQGFELMIVSSGSACGSACGVFNVTYTINPVFNGSMFVSGGAKLYRADRPDANDKVFGMTCRGKSLRFMDIKRAFGSYIHTPTLKTRN